MKIDKYYNKNPSDEKKGQQGAEEVIPDHHLKSNIHIGSMLEKAYNNKFVLLSIVIGIIIINIILRAGLLQYQGPFEPDGFFYFSF